MAAAADETRTTLAVLSAYVRTYHPAARAGQPLVLSQPLCRSPQSRQ
eukprot:COSAG06_NODE_3899_length_4792_cov_20.315273_1_plen_46_part_10